MSNNHLQKLVNGNNFFLREDFIELRKYSILKCEKIEQFLQNAPAFDIPVLVLNDALKLLCFTLRVPSSQY